MSGGAPGVGLAEDELTTVPGWAAHRARLAGRDGSAQDPVRTHPGQHLHGQISQEEGQAGCVVAGVRDDEDVRVIGLSLPCGDQSLDQFAQLSGGDSGGVISGRQPKRVQRRGP
ncbi:hypothetical protein GCM10023323_21190 [Streptomyces thinghirensis]|uniref:Uncharacterized protein n=1 Tax=Streptomyces thinghirensis TaxID=551547 RepID=A0ABP9T2A4_9ACTN